MNTPPQFHSTKKQQQALLEQVVNHFSANWKNHLYSYHQLVQSKASWYFIPQVMERGRRCP